jgi:hypothetical protein
MLSAAEAAEEEITRIIRFHLSAAPFAYETYDSHFRSSFVFLIIIYHYQLCS